MISRCPYCTQKPLAAVHSLLPVRTLTYYVTSRIKVPARKVTNEKEKKRKYKTA